MFCEVCGAEIEEGDRFCRMCGAVIGDGSPGGKGKSCARSRNERMVAGVCAGTANYFNKDPALVRIVWTLAALIPPLFPGAVAYVVCWLLMPAESGTDHNTATNVGTAAVPK